jgi:hypothetical protein
MNKLIHDLAQQAGDYVNSVYKPPVRSKTPGKIWEDGHVDWHTQFNEKFANLIIQDCLQKIELEAAQYAEPVWSVELVNDIKEHFGLQE